MKAAKPAVLVGVIGAAIVAWSHGGQAWSVFRALLVLLASARLAIDVAAVVRRRIHPGRLLLAGTVLGLVLAVGNGALSRTAALSVLGLVELLALGIVLVAFFRQAPRSGRSATPEAALAERLEVLFPPALAQVAATELILFAAAFRAPGLVMRASSPSAISYVENAKLKLLVLIVPVIVVPDLVVVQIVVPAHLLWLRLVLAGLSLYAVIWVWGTFATMARREHELGGDLIVFYRGLLNQARVDPAWVDGVEVVPPRRGWAAMRRREGEADLGVAGVAGVRITLSQPVAVHGLAGWTGPRVTKIVVPSDRPDMLATRIAALAAAASALKPTLRY